MNKLNIILQGGGSRCSYQLGFFKKILANPEFHKKFLIQEIYGTSFGALVGYFIAIGRLDILENFFRNLNSNSLQTWFNLNIQNKYFNLDLGKYLYQIPGLGLFFKFIIYSIWFFISIFKKSLFNQNIPAIQDLFNLELTQEQKNNLINYRCCVFNISKQKSEYIPGDHPLIFEYIKASSALWILFQPKKIHQLKSECVCNLYNCDCLPELINNINFCGCSKLNHKYNEYIDGGLLRSVPYPEIINPEIINLVLTTDNIEKILNKKFNFENTGDNLFEYLEKLISFLVDNLHSCYLKNTEILKNLTIINYDCKNNKPAVTDQNIISKYILDGEQIGQEFLDNLNNLKKISNYQFRG